MGGKVRDIRAYPRPERTGHNQGGSRLLQMPQSHSSISLFVPSFYSQVTDDYELLDFTFCGNAEVTLQGNGFNQSLLNREIADGIRRYLTESGLSDYEYVAHKKPEFAYIRELNPPLCTVVVEGVVSLKRRIRLRAVS